MKWVSKPPGKLPPFTNIIRVFDNQCWAWIGASILFFILAYWIVWRLGPSYGMICPLDKVLIILLPLLIHLTCHPLSHHRAALHVLCPEASVWTYDGNLAKFKQVLSRINGLLIDRYDHHGPDVAEEGHG